MPQSPSPNGRAAVLVAGVFRIPGAELFAYGYRYLAMLLALAGAFIGYVLGAHRVSRGGRMIGYLLGASLAAGFWGQLLLDTSVWSHIVALPLLAAIFYSVLHPGPRNGEPSTSAGGDFRLSLLLYFAAFLIYPEAAAVLALLLTLTLAAGRRPRSRAAIHGGAFALAVIIATAMDYAGATEFFADQLRSGVSDPKRNASWFLYFFQPYFGYDFTGHFSSQIEALKAMANTAGPFAVIRTRAR